MQKRFIVLAACLGAFLQTSLHAANPPAPLTLTVGTNGQRTLTWPLVQALEELRLSQGANVTNLNVNLTSQATKSSTGYQWTGSNGAPQQFYGLRVGQLGSNALLSANVLNRLAYGQTPDELERLASIGPQAYIDEQLNMGGIVDNLDSYVVETTNGVTLPPVTAWNTVTVTGLYTTATLYMYLTTVGEVSIDDVQMRYSYTLTAVTNTAGVLTTNVTSNLSNNLLVNGDFEQSLTNGWTVSANLTNSVLDTVNVNSGASSLRMISTAPGTTQGSSIWQTVAAAPVTTRGTNVPTDEIYTNTISNLRVVLSFAYLPDATSGNLLLRLSGSGTIISGADAPPAPAWVYATATGLGTGTPRFYIYSDGSGEFYIDDIKLVRGTVPEAGTNLLANGDFETGVLAPWQFTTDFTNSIISSNYSHRGSYSLKVVATGAGAGGGDAVFYDNIFGVTNGGTYTVSFWYLPSTRGRLLTTRLSGSATVGLLNASPDTTIGSIRRRMDSIAMPRFNDPQVTVNSIGGVLLADLRAWYVQNCVGSKRQLLEVLTQFLENHFVTQHSKSYDFFDNRYDGNIIEVLATDWEWREVSKWRNALLDPNCTFYDLLRISAESPAMINYLDTVNSRGDANNVANENYARELFELFCMGVDNGYEQNDIVAQSRAWTGWTVGIVDPPNINNPFAPASTTYGFYPNNAYNAASNTVGVWTFVYNSGVHGTNRAPLLSVWSTNSTATNLIALGPKTVPARYGPPWAGQSYQLAIPRRTGTNSIQDGYQVIGHLATNVVMTAEYISVKLCRLFVHTDFPNPTTRPELAEYAFYDYTSANITAEAQLVHQCIQAWYAPGPDGRRGNIRSVLRTIFDSELFRSHGGTLQKVKTPVEYAVSAIRALRSQNPDGSFTASTDGYSISGRSRTASSAPLTRMGVMMLFDRDAPDGYPEDGSPWISAGTIAERLRYVQTSLMYPTDAGKADGITGGNFNLTDPVTLLRRKLPQASWVNAGAVADYFLSILYPAEGKVNLDQYRQSAVNFLNTADDGVTPSLFTSLSTSGTPSPYESRVRGMVALLMALPRFQEQ